MNTKKLALLSLLSMASLNATPWYQSVAKKVAEVVSPYKKEAVIAAGIVGTVAAGYKIIVSQQKNPLLERLLLLEEANNYIELFKENISHQARCHSRILSLKKQLLSSHINESDKNDIRSQIAQLSSVININIDTLEKVTNAKKSIKGSLTDEDLEHLLENKGGLYSKYLTFKIMLREFIAGTKVALGADKDYRILYFSLLSKRPFLGDPLFSHFDFLKKDILNNFIEINCCDNHGCIVEKYIAIIKQLRSHIQNLLKANNDMLYM